MTELDRGASLTGAIEVHERIEAVADEWEDLADRGGESPFMRPGWFAAWWSAFGAGAPAIVALRRDGRLAALVPFMRKGGALASPTNWHTPEFTLLAEDEDAERELTRSIFRGRPRRVTLGFLNADEPDLGECRAAARTSGYRVITRTLERSPYVRIDGDWTAYERNLDKHRLSEARRRRRRLEERGRLSFAVEDGADRLDELLEQGFRIEGSGWKSSEGTAIVSRPETRAFYTDVAHWAAARGSLRLAFLRLDDRPIAFYYLIAEGGVVYHLKGGYDQELAKFAPGTLITQEVLAWAFAEGCSRYEFLGDEEPFKLAWTSETRERVLFQAFAPNPAGLAAWAAFSYARPLAKRVLALVRR